MHKYSLYWYKIFTDHRTNLSVILITDFFPISSNLVLVVKSMPQYHLILFSCSKPTAYQPGPKIKLWQWLETNKPTDTGMKILQKCSESLSFTPIFFCHSHFIGIACENGGTRKIHEKFHFYDLILF